jgi:hypothetical protein
MNSYVHILILSLIQAIGCGNAQGHGADDTLSLLKDLFEPDSRTNMAIVEHTDSSAYYTNLISNKNLLSQQEQQLLQGILEKYSKLTTNSPPSGSVLVSFERTNGFWRGHYSYPKSRAREDIRFGDRSSKAVVATGRGYAAFADELGPDVTIAKFRYKDEEGYDVLLCPPDANETSTSPMYVVQIRGGIPDGLFIEIHGTHFNELVHFVNGHAFGPWFIAAPYGRGKVFEIKVQAPVDYFRYMTQEIKNCLVSRNCG